MTLHWHKLNSEKVRGPLKTLESLKAILELPGSVKEWHAHDVLGKVAFTCEDRLLVAKKLTASQ